MAVAPRNDFLVAGGGANANVLTQAQYAGLPSLTTGVISGKASAQHANKVWRQTSIMSAMIAKFIVDRVNHDVIDDGTIATIETDFIAAIQSLFVLGPSGVTPGTYGPTMTLSVQLDGRITGISNGGLTGTGITPGTYVGTTITVGTDGRITGIVGVAYGPLANNNLWAQTQRSQGGWVATGADSGTMHFRALAGVGVAAYGSGLLNDGSSTYLLSTVAGSPTGIYSSYRPFAWNMATGAVTIDATGRGVSMGGALNVAGGVNAAALEIAGAAIVGGAVTASGAISSGGPINSTGNIIANSGRLRAAFGAFGSGDSQSAALLIDFPFGGSWTRLPNGLILQWGQAGPTGHNDVILFPIAFPHACLSITASEAGAVGWDTGGGSGTPSRCSVYATQIINTDGFFMSCAQIDNNGGSALSMRYAPDFGHWMAIGW